MLCAGPPDASIYPSSSSCSGDSGGALFTIGGPPVQVCQPKRCPAMLPETPHQAFKHGPLLPNAAPTWPTTKFL